MIRKLRIALANWIMPKPLFIVRSGTRFIRECAPTSMLTVVDGKMVEVMLDRGHQPGLSRFPFDGSGPVGDEI